MVADRPGRYWPGRVAGLALALAAGPPLATTVAVVAILAGLVPQHPELAFSAGLIGLTLAAATQADDGEEWLSQTWSFAKLILPLLLGGVLLAGFLLGRPGHEGIIPSEWVSAAVGGNSLAANFVSALVGAFMYFATLTEVPIVQGIDRFRHGQGASAGVAAGGSGVVAAEHAGHSRHSRYAKDGGLLFAGGGHGDYHRHGVRYVLSLRSP